MQSIWRQSISRRFTASQASRASTAFINFSTLSLLSSSRLRILPPRGRPGHRRITSTHPLALLYVLIDPTSPVELLQDMVKTTHNTPADTPEPQAGVRRKMEDDDSTSRAAKKARTRVRYVHAFFSSTSIFPAFLPQCVSIRCWTWTVSASVSGRDSGSPQ